MSLTPELSKWFRKSNKTILAKWIRLPIESTITTRLHRIIVKWVLREGRVRVRKIQLKPWKQ